MDNATRLKYLQAMGIDVWVPKADEFVALSTNCEQTSPLAQTAVAVQGGSDAGMRQRQQEVGKPEQIEAWRALQEEVAACQRCDLCKTRTQTVFGSGNPHAEWMLIGEAPGQSEDQEGKPFVGKAGLLLTEMLRAMDLQRDEVFIANILKCRPPNNRDPSADEAAACSGYLQRQISFVQPKIILAVGRIAAQHLLNTDAPLAKLRGSVHQLEGTPMLVIYHPAYLLRSLLEKRKTWDDLQLAMNVYRQQIKERPDIAGTLS